MIVKSLYLRNFLSYEEIKLNFDDGLNIIRGHNASGKTNLVEAILMSSIGKTARNIRDKDIINWNADGEEGATVITEVKKKHGDHTVEIYINAAGQKFIKIDQTPISRLGELLGVINAVYFSPDELKLIKESPADRRKFIDISLSQQSKTYFYTLIKYNKLLKHRNKLLKEYKDKTALEEMLSVVDESLLPCVELITLKRKEFIEKIQPFAQEQHGKITGGKESMEIKYETEDIDFSDIKASMKELYLKNREKDRKMEYTNNGVHRDDLKIMAGGIDVRKYGSQGQQRTAVLSLKLAEIFMFKSVAGEFPVLLLDDVLSELDYDRQKALLEVTNNLQTIITCTEFDKSLAKGREYKDIAIKKRTTA
ncbi:MAG: DNA replication/repair protein RecF [Christensenellales bacterium]|jgi:DNA replication and repair protein RecF|nr:DNA replication/repair protein RecF [Clostridiales bacterium]